MSEDTSYVEELMFGRKAGTPSENIVCKIAADLSRRWVFDLDTIDEEMLRELAQDWVAIVESEWPGPQIVIAGEIKGGVTI